MDAKISPINEYVFVVPIEEKKDTKGIIIPHTAEQESQKGKVVAVSEKADKNLKIGDVVMFKKRVIHENKWFDIEIEGEKYLKMRDAQIMGIVFGEDAVDVSPLKEFVFIEWEMAADTYGKSGLIRPEAYKQMHFTGLVVAVGPDVKQVKVGERVFFDQFSGLEQFQEDDKRYTFVQEKDIYCTQVPKREEVLVAK